METQFEDNFEASVARMLELASDLQERSHEFERGIGALIEDRVRIAQIARRREDGLSR